MSLLSRAREGGSRTPVVVIGLALAVACLSAIALYSSPDAVKARESEARLAAAQAGADTAPPPALVVDAFRVERAPAAQRLELAGSLEAIRATWLSAEIAGRIVEVSAREHAPVSAGEVLVRLDDALPRAELIRAEAAHTLAEAELARQQRLGRSSVASEAELDRAVSEERATWATLLEARTRLSHSEIRAPFDGVVNDLDLDPGTYVQPGTRIAEVLDVATLEVTVQVSDRQVGAIEPGAEVAVRVDALGNQRLPGRVDRVGRAPNSETRRFPVVVALPNLDGQLLPGMLAQVELEVGGSAALRVPARALMREFELDYVYLLEAADDGDRARVRRVRVGTRPVPFRPDWIEIRSGLPEKARVVVSGLGKLRDGDIVRISATQASP